jgi:hypothetical protein
MRPLCVAICVFMSAASPAGADVKSELLFDITLDLDADGKLDRAALLLVGPGRDTAWDLLRGHYPLSDAETVDLAIYLGAGDALFDIDKPPTILKQGIVDRERTRWVQELEVANTGSLKVTSNYQPGATNDLQETLTIAWRKGQFLVVGYDLYWENPNGIGNCQLNLSTGQGIRAAGEFPGPKPNFRAKVKPVPLAKWGEKTRPTQCDQQE